MFTPPDSIPGLEFHTVGTGKNAVRNLEGDIVLPCWSGFLNGRESEGRLSSEGHARITLGGDMISGHPSVQSFHILAYRYLLEFQQQIQEQILLALKSEYEKMQAMYCYDTMIAGAIMPDVQEIQQFKKLIGLSAVHLLNISKDDMAYVGYEFGCTWDREFGLGVMTHKNRIIEIGDASTAFLSWVADKDKNPAAENYDSIFIEFRENEILTPPNKPWWRFW